MNKIPTKYGMLHRSAYILTLGLMASVYSATGSNTNSSSILLILAISVLAIFANLLIDALRNTSIKKIIKNRTEQLKQNFSKLTITTDIQDLTHTSIFQELASATSSVKVINVNSCDNWCAVDFSCLIEYGDYRNPRTDHNLYYSVIVIDTGYELPTFIFDSKESLGRQMKFSFDINQKVALEGNFDKYFDVYHSAGYHIDLLNIITPDIMEKLIEAHDFDIEFYGTKIYLYSKIASHSKLLHMINSAQSIAVSIKRNASAYSDVRAVSKKRVHPLGKSLQKNFTLTTYANISVGLAIILIGSIFNRGVNLIFYVSIGIVAILYGATVYQHGLNERKKRRLISNAHKYTSRRRNF